ncbi:Protein CNGC15c [Asimina triloba]
MKLIDKVNGAETPELSHTKGDERQLMDRSLGSKKLSRVYSEDLERVNKKILDPRGPVMHRWNKIFLVACIVSLFIDPMFFYLPSPHTEFCLGIGHALKTIFTVVRSIADLFYAMRIFIRFRTAFVAPSSRVFGRGELVIDAKKIASRYLAKAFWIDLLAALPIPQVLIWLVIPNIDGSSLTQTRTAIRFCIAFQYIPRLYQIFPLSSQIIKATGVVTQTAWAGAAYNMVLYMLASHVAGACWYILSVERVHTCWEMVCALERPLCKHPLLDCGVKDAAARDAWLRTSNITDMCSPTGSFDFGIFGDALTYGVLASSLPFFRKYFYTLWWGLRNLSCLGQNLTTSTDIGEILFSFMIGTVGLVLLGLLIGNVQTYLQSSGGRLEECRIKKMDTEKWMHHRKLPLELQRSVRRYGTYKWIATRGVNEEAILQDLPTDLRRDIKRHLCLDLIQRVPLFEEMDDRTLDAICERLRPALCTSGTCLVREGDPLREMTFIIRGRLDSYTTDGGRSGFFNSSRLGPGDFCGEELLTWALDTRDHLAIPASTRTVRALSDVEAFALGADELEFVASQFRKLHSKKLRRKLRFYSHQWRTWAARCIQAAWRRHSWRKLRRQTKLTRSCKIGCGGGPAEAAAASSADGESFAVQAMRIAAVEAARRQFLKCKRLAELKPTDSEAEEEEDAVVGKEKKPHDPHFSEEE